MSSCDYVRVQQVIIWDLPPGRGITKSNDNPIVADISLFVHCYIHLVNREPLDQVLYFPCLCLLGSQRHKFHHQGFAQMSV